MKLTPKQQRRLVEEFRRIIYRLDHGRCRNPNCIGDSYQRNILSAHHIKYKSHGVDHSPENGILLCRGCDHAVHHGIGKGDERLSAREFMLKILNDLIDDPEYRWHAVHQVLRDRYETTDEGTTMETKQDTPEHDLFAVYEKDGFLVIDHPHEDTGELVPIPIGQLPVPKRLTGIGFAIRNAEAHRDGQLAILKEQAGIIRQHVDRVKEVAAKTIDQLASMGSNLLRQLHAEGLAATDTKKRPRLPIAGCGTWATNTTKRASVDSTRWDDDLDKDAKAEIVLAHKDLFTVDQITVIKPDKKAILKALQTGRMIDGFTMNAAEDHVVFKVEKGTGVPAIGTSARQVGE